MNRYEMPVDYFLNNGYPNPFNNYVNIEYGISRISPVNIIILDLMGREVKNLMGGLQSPGVHRIKWDGTDLSGNNVSSGIYFIICQINNFQKIVKVNLMR